MPGEADTRGKPEQICAGMISQRIFQECTAIKGVVMVLPKDAFSGRYEALQSLLMKVSAIFVEMSDEEMMQHLKLVVTKTQGMEKRQIMLKLQKIYDEPKSCEMLKRMLAGLIRNPMKVILVDVDNLEMLAKLQFEFAHTEALSAHRFAFASDSDPLVIFKQILTFMQSEEEKLRLALLTHQQLFAQMLHQEILELSKQLLSFHKTEEGEKFQALLLQLSRLIAPWLREDITMQVKDFSRFYDITKDLLMRAQLHQAFLSTMLLMDAMEGKPAVRMGMPI